MTWNYRVIAFEHDGETTHALHEVFYTDDGKPDVYTKYPARISWDAAGGNAEALLALERMREALAKPVLTPRDFQQKDPPE
jgi:hypothetical protein